MEGGVIIERVEAALRIVASLSGLAEETMTQLAGWRFLELGRRIERAIVTGGRARCFALAGAPGRVVSKCCGVR